MPEIYPAISMQLTTERRVWRVACGVRHTRGDARGLTGTYYFSFQ
jgi:hypothetical protein